MIADWEVMRRLSGADEIRPAYKFNLKGPDRPVDEQRQLEPARSRCRTQAGRWKATWIIQRVMESFMLAPRPITCDMIYLRLPRVYS